MAVSPEEAKSIPTSFRLFLIEPTSRKQATRGLDPHCTGAGIFDRLAFETRVPPVINIPSATDVICSHPVVRKDRDGILPATTAQLSGIVGEGLPLALDVVEQSYFSANRLSDPDRHRVGAVAGAADVEKRFDGKDRID